MAENDYVDVPITEGKRSGTLTTYSGSGRVLSRFDRRDLLKLAGLDEQKRWRRTIPLSDHRAQDLLLERGFLDGDGRGMCLGTYVSSNEAGKSWALSCLDKLSSS